jgi:phosphoglycerate dehydrogenase-like enzyme
VTTVGCRIALSLLPPPASLMYCLAMSTIVWVLARPNDPGLHVLEPPPEGVLFVVGWEPAEFDRAPAPDALLSCRGGTRRLDALLERAPALRWIHARSAGLDHLLSEACVAHPAVVTNGRGAFSGALGEFVVAALLHFAKDVPRLLEAQRRASWEPFETRALSGQTIGIVGYGDIGRAAAGRLKPFGVRILALRQRPELSAGDPLVDEALGPGDVVDLARRSDAVVLATPLTPGTRGLFGREAIAAMRPTAVLVNVGRGPAVDEAALVEALRARRIRGAALDVFETEPLPATSALWSLPNVLLSPHCADNVHGWLEGAMRVFLKNLELFRAGRPFPHVVDKQRGY